MATPRKLTVTDAHLAEALAGRAYLLFDGGMGTLVQAAGLHAVHAVPDLLNLTHPEAIVAIQRQYVEAGADCITTNTFSANRLKLASTDATVAEVYAAAAANARAAGAPLVAGDIGPTGALLEPLGTLTFDEAFDIFSEQAWRRRGGGLRPHRRGNHGRPAGSQGCRARCGGKHDAAGVRHHDLRRGRPDLPRHDAGHRRPRRCRRSAPRPWGSTGLAGPTELAPLVGELAPHDRALVMAQPTRACPAFRTARPSSTWA